MFSTRALLRFLSFPLCVVLLPALAGCTRAPVQDGGDGESTSHPSLATRHPEVIVTKTGIEMVLIPAGNFLMGDDGGEDDE